MGQNPSSTECLEGGNGIVGDGVGFDLMLFYSKYILRKKRKTSLNFTMVIVKGDLFSLLKT